MKKIPILTLVLTSAVLAAGIFAQSQAHSHDHSAKMSSAQGKHGMMGGKMMDDKMMAKCHAMMQKQAKLHTDMMAMNGKLDGMVSTMNSAVGVEKVDATAAVVSELVTQRESMQMKMSSMQTDMMQHMMEHMQMVQMGKKSMMMCPMMNGMKDMSGMKDMKGM